MEFGAVIGKMRLASHLGLFDVFNVVLSLLITYLNKMGR